METPCQRHRRPTYFLCASSRASSFLVFPPEQSFFHFVQNSGPEFRDKDCERWKRHSSPPKFPPQQLFPRNVKNESTPTRGKSTQNFPFHHNNNCDIYDPIDR